MGHEMRVGSDLSTKRKGRWLAAFVLAVVHLVAFGMLYLVLVQLNWLFQDYYKLLGTKLTTDFERIASVSNYIAAYTPLVLLVVGLDTLVVLQLARRCSRWTSL